jgi:hypothetical protein
VSATVGGDVVMRSGDDDLEVIVERSAGIDVHKDMWAAPRFPDSWLVG